MGERPPHRTAAIATASVIEGVTVLGAVGCLNSRGESQGCRVGLPVIGVGGRGPTFSPTEFFIGGTVLAVAAFLSIDHYGRVAAPAAAARGGRIAGEHRPRVTFTAADPRNPRSPGGMAFQAVCPCGWRGRRHYLRPGAVAERDAHRGSPRRSGGQLRRVA